MKRKLFALIIFAMALVISGCGNFDNYSKRDKVVEELDPTRNQERSTNQNTDNKLGYVSYTKDQMKNEPKQNVTIDRNKMADMISRIILQHKDFGEVATLVTDEDVLIAYEANDRIDDEDAADIAKKSALSVMPQYFDIHVSNNDGGIMNDIRSLHNSSTQNKNYDNYKDEIIKKMKNSPQDDKDNNKE